MSWRTGEERKIDSALDQYKIEKKMPADMRQNAIELDNLKKMEKLWTSEWGQELIKTLIGSSSRILFNLRDQILNPDLNTIVASLSQYFAMVDMLATINWLDAVDQLQDQLDKEVKEFIKIHKDEW